MTRRGYNEPSCRNRSVMRLSANWPRLPELNRPLDGSCQCSSATRNVVGSPPQAVARIGLRRPMRIQASKKQSCCCLVFGRIQAVVRVCRMDKASRVCEPPMYCALQCQYRPLFDASSALLTVRPAVGNFFAIFRPFGRATSRKLFGCP